jgi:hypothetical protein
MDVVDVEEDVVRVLANLGIVHWDRQNDALHLHDVVQRVLVTFLGTNAASVHQRLVDSWGDRQRLPHKYAWERICWHLRKANQPQEIRKLLLNVSWIEAKIRQVGLLSLLQDMGLVPDDAEVLQGKSALLLSASIVSLRACQKRLG